ncbi:hypothetical protein DRN98_04155 [Methanosarcinales archaeon]|nr:MAG: hypothetical protein DRN98_04155 [Methanosarcinales archaeon]
MSRMIIKAVYEDNVLKPLEKLDFWGMKNE